MNRAFRSALAICCLAFPSAAAFAAAVEMVTRLEWPGFLGVRCEVPLGIADLLLRCGAGPDGPIRITVGLESPFLRAGPLAATGLLCEAASPLGYGPGSGVFGEATGLRLDRSMSGPEGLSVEFSPVPQRLALFWLHPDGEPGLWGVAVSTGPREPFVLEAVASVSEPGPDPPGDSWFRVCAPIPAGRVLHGASRIRVDVDGLAATVSAGMSAAARAPPGWFVLGTAAVGRGDAGLDLMAAGVSSGYFELGGGKDPGGLRAGLRLRLAAADARILARYVMSVGVPGVAPKPFLPSDEELTLVMDRRWPMGIGAWEAGLSLSNRVETDADGVEADNPSGSLSVGWDSARLQAAVTLDVDRDEGAGIVIMASTADTADRWRIGGEVRCAWTGYDPVSVSLTGHARWALGSGEVRLRAGVRNLCPVHNSADGTGPWTSVEWRVTDRSCGG